MDLHLDLDSVPGRTLRARAEHALREAVRSGRLAPGSRLPATRALATQLGVSRGVVVEAYAQLAAEGYLDTRRGGGTRVAEHPGPPTTATSTTTPTPTGGVEEPGWWRIGRSLAEAGLTPVPIPTDDHGLDPSHLADLNLDAIAVTPAHQFPTGAVLPPERRAQLVAWARDRGALILEDDYDAEFRYDRQPVGSLQGLAPDLVAYGGSCSKTLAPALRLGWLVLPSSLVAELHADDATAPPGTPPTIDQLALADLIERGELDRHLRRQRHRYRKRRDALLEELARQLPGLDVRGAAAGLFAVLALPAGADEHTVVAAALARGVVLEPLGAAGRTGLVVGYANLPEAGAAAAVAALAQAIQETTMTPARPAT
ncbi:MAG: PLP-dependent aminotransferase family protein [Solirubrobacterales bacterium]